MTDMMVLVGPPGLISIGTRGFDFATGMMVLVGPRGPISVGRMRYQLVACHTFHMHACMAAASEGWVLDLVRIDLDGRQEGYQRRCLSYQSLRDQIFNLNSCTGGFLAIVDISSGGLTLARTSPFHSGCGIQMFGLAF